MSKLFLVEDFGPGPRNNVNQCKPIAMVMMREGPQQAFGIWNPTIWTRLDLFDLCAVLPPPSKKQQLRHKHHLHFTFVLSRGIEGGQLLVDQSEWPLKALASLPPLPPLLLQLTHYYHHCLLNINACKERLWPEKWMNFRKKERGGGVTPIRKKFVADFRISRKNATLLTLFPFFAFSIAMHWSTSQSGHWAGSCFHPES